MVLNLYFLQLIAVLPTSLFHHIMDSTEVLISPALIHPIPEPIIAPSLPSRIANQPPSCPWSKVASVEAVSLNDVMSEQLAISLQEPDEINSAENTVYLDDLKSCGEEVTDCSDDFLLAKMLQLEFDKEHDNILKHEESKYNGASKVKISYDKYLRRPEANASSDEDEDDREYFLEQNAANHWNNFDNAEKAFQAVGKSGVSRQGNTTTTKHDPTVCGRRNAGKMMEFPPGFSTGDGGMFDMKISNNVYNSLKSYSIAEDRRGHKVHDKREKATTEKALDERTHLILYKLINNQTLEYLSGCVSTGKEACVYHAWSGLPEGESPSPEFAIKVFKTTLNEFQNRDQYIKDDYRFKNRFSKQNPRKVIHMWAEKEMRNLMRMKEADIPCPTVVTLKKHVLVMSFIGEKMMPAPKLKDVDLPFADMTIIYEQTVDIMKTMYCKCKLVHADLSEYNLLYHDEKIWVIDVSQAIEITHPRSTEFLLRDCVNITNFFQKKGVRNVPKPEQLCAEIVILVPDKYQSVPSKRD